MKNDGVDSSPSLRGMSRSDRGSMSGTTPTVTFGATSLQREVNKRKSANDKDEQISFGAFRGVGVYNINRLKP